ncbi:hypothetical protein F2Q68_00005806 [Brassica cretica]|uniref:LRR receptor-like serine/threonine-protein kinase n=1 Tax=Brassica cretica TaxID=69181 RepID=A0A8S9JAV6_BRACR|nr:hypothetical protein F2Q68_00005806 [Brassica cretica]
MNLITCAVHALEEIATTLGIKRVNLSYKDPCDSQSLMIIKQADRNLEVNNTIACDCSFNNNMTCHITELSLVNLTLVGKVPPELANLRHLRSIDLSANYLTGTIPPKESKASEGKRGFEESLEEDQSSKAWEGQRGFVIVCDQRRRYLLTCISSCTWIWESNRKLAVSSMADSSPFSEAYNVPMGDQELAFLRTEWEHLAKNAEETLTRFGAIDKRLATSDSRFDAMDRRFDQLTMILTRMENNQLTDKAQGKALASPSNSPGPAMFSLLRGSVLRLIWF